MWKNARKKWKYAENEKLGQIDSNPTQMPIIFYNPLKKRKILNPPSSRAHDMTFPPIPFLFLTNPLSLLGSLNPEKPDPPSRRHLRSPASLSLSLRTPATTQQPHHPSSSSSTLCFMRVQPAHQPSSAIHDTTQVKAWHEANFEYKLIMQRNWVGI